MNLYWVYDLPNWLFALLTISIYMLFGLAGVLLTRKRVRRLHIQDHSHNDIVSYYLAAVTVFYGITLGLVAIGTWNNFSAINDKVDEEAQALASIYRDAASLPEPLNQQLQADLTAYTKNVIEVSWPQQQKGITPSQSGAFLDRFQQHLNLFSPKSLRDEVLDAELVKQYDTLVEYRRARLNATLTQLPMALWALVILGSVICIVVSFFFDVKSFAMHLTMTSLFSLLLGLMIFLVGALDNPFRGGVSVKPTALQLVYQHMIKH